MTSTEQKGLSPSRICNSSDCSFTDLECPVCHDILWKPVACQTCETPFCTPCIHQWSKNETKCPSGCKIYVERKCPPFIAKLLARLQIACFYQSKGCQQILSYEALEKHELECNYQTVQCPGCEMSIIKKEFSNHKRCCGAIKITCKDCKLDYKRNDFNKRHTQNSCLKEQLRQVREEAEESKLKIQSLISQMNDLLTWKNRISHEKVIIFDDLPNADEETRWIPPTYKGLKWTKMVHMARAYAVATYPTSGYMAAFAAGSNRHIAFFNEEALLSTDKPNETFTLVSVTACAAWNDNLLLTVTGYRDSAQVNTHTATLLFGKPQIILLQWQNIDKIVFKPTGDSAHLDNHEAATDTHCILTQLIINELR